MVHPTKTAGMKDCGHPSYAARLLRHTIGATPQPGGPGTRGLAQRAASVPTRVEATCFLASLARCAVQEAWGNLSAQPVDQKDTSENALTPNPDPAIAVPSNVSEVDSR